MMPLRTMPEGVDASVVDISLDDRVRKLVEGDYEDGPEEIMAELQRSLRHGDRRIAAQLADVARSPEFGADGRSLAIETLTAARSRHFEPEAYEAVRVALESASPRLQFAGIAAVSDLSRKNQFQLRRVVAGVIRAPAASESVKRAGAAFLGRRP